MLRVTLSELSHLPVERLAKLLMEWAIEDQRLLVGPVAEVVEIRGGVISGLSQRARLGGETPMEITPWRRIALSRQPGHRGC